jgi:protein-tyrosine-phosphatase
METRMAFVRTSPILKGVGRRGILVGGSLVFAFGRAEAACAPTRVLFVCPAGTVKSAIAREALKRRAASEGVAVSVSSRGVHPEDHVSAALAVNLRKDGLDPASEPVRELAEQDIAHADLVIAFDEAADLPSLRAARAWKTPSWNNDYAMAKADLEDRLTDLLTELKARAAKPCATR